MIAIALAVLRYAWPFVLAASIYGVQEVRVLGLRSSLDASHKREIALQSQVDVARQRATDLALLYAEQLPKIDKARADQEALDGNRMDALNDRISALSRELSIRISADAVRVWGDVAAAANGNAAAPAAPAGGTKAVPAPADTYLSEADVLAHEAMTAEAYRDAVRMFHECRDLYNAARNAQIAITKGQ